MNYHKGVGKIKNLLKNPLAVNSLILFVGATISNLSNYIFTLITGRLLGPADYGIFNALSAVLLVISVPALTLMTVAVKFAAEYRGRKETGRLLTFFKQIHRFFWGVGILLTVASFALSSIISEYLHIPTPLYYLVLSLSYLLIFPQAICFGVLQGWQLFGWYAFVGALGTLLKLFAGAGAAWVGWGVAGVLGAFFLSYLVQYLLSLRPILRLGPSPAIKERFDWRSPLVYSLPVFLTMLGLTLFMTTDMIIVKRFFPPYEAGIYSALSLLGKTVLWISTSIVQVMFALVAEKKAAKKDDSGYFLASLFLVGVFCLLVSTVFSIFPKQVVWLSFGPRYLDAGSYLAFYCLFITLYSLINVFANYFLSCGKVVAASLVLVGALIQLGLLGIFHHSFMEVISVSSLICLVLLLVMIGAYLFSGRMRRVYPLGQT